MRQFGRGNRGAGAHSVALMGDLIRKVGIVWWAKEQKEREKKVHNNSQETIKTSFIRQRD